MSERHTLSATSDWLTIFHINSQRIMWIYSLYLSAGTYLYTYTLPGTCTRNSSLTSCLNPDEPPTLLPLPKPSQYLLTLPGADFYPFSPPESQWFTPIFRKTWLCQTKVLHHFDCVLNDYILFSFIDIQRIDTLRTMLFLLINV